MNTVNYDESEYDDHDDMHHMYIHIIYMYVLSHGRLKEDKSDKPPLRVPELDVDDVDETRKFRFYLDRLDST